MEINSMNIFYSVGLAETIIIKMRGFATYVPPSLSSTTYLPHPATTCQFHTLYLPLPASLYLPLHYLPLPGSYLRLPIPATVHCFHLPQSANNPQKFLLEDQAQNIFYLVCFLKPWFLTNITSKKGKTTPGFARFFAEKVQKRVRCKWPTRGRTPLPLHNLQMTL